jgi:tRNA G46 methylase TrmB
MMSMPAEFIANLVGSSQGAKWKVLDIAAGHGYFGIAIARHNPNATIVAADWHKVLEVAKEHALKAGVAETSAESPPAKHCCAKFMRRSSRAAELSLWILFQTKTACRLQPRPHSAL